MPEYKMKYSSPDLPPKRGIILYLNPYKDYIIRYFQFLYFEKLTFVWVRRLFSQSTLVLK